jgi:hypothetical protein
MCADVRIGAEFSILWAKDRLQQKSPETEVSDVVHAPKDCENHKNQLCPSRKFIEGSIERSKHDCVN